MAHATAQPSFHDLPTALHREVASYLYADEALATGATGHAMGALYPASITHAFIQPRLLSDCGLDADCGWEAYYAMQGASLARLLARMPFLEVLETYRIHDLAINHAIFLQSCKQLRFIKAVRHPSGSNLSQFCPKSPCPVGPSRLHLAMAKGHLPSFERLSVGSPDDASILAEAMRAGHLSHAMALLINCNDKPLQLRSLLEAFKAHKGKLQTISLYLNHPSDLTTQDLMHELLASPVCSDLHALQVSPNIDDGNSSAMRFVSDFLRGAGGSGKPSLRALYFSLFNNNEDVSHLSNALLLGTAPNLETVFYDCAADGTVAQLGSDLFARGALASIITLIFTKANFDGEYLTALIDGYRQSGHNGGTLQTLLFGYCNVLKRTKPSIKEGTREASLALIAGLKDGVFPNLQELLIPQGALLVRQVPKLVMVLKREAPCARTLRKVVLSRLFLRPADVESLQAVLPQATVILGGEGYNVSIF